jgi:preprotein translocase subunit SecF
MMEILGKTNIDFMEKRNIAFMVSSILIFLGVLAIVGILVGWANLGIDFAGGTAVQLKFDKPLRIADARKALDAHGLRHAELQEFPQDQKLLIRVKTDTTIEEDISEKIIEAFKSEFPEHGFVVDLSTSIGPAIGKKLQEDALIAIVLSLAGIVLYVALRFEFRFGVSAAIATFHDVLAVLGIYFLLDKEITLLVVTALLTLAGYSLTDTVIIFDRIRENLRQRRREAMTTIINNGINQVLSRTLITTLTVILVLVPLTLWGGEVLHDFSLALLLGIIVGSYSSIFVASPLLLLLPGSEGKLLSRSKG